MSRLFWKIFLSFWFSLILFAVASILAASSYLEHTRAQDAIDSPRDRIAGYIVEGRSIAKTEGTEGLKKWLSKLDRAEAIPFLLIDTEGNDLLARPISPRLAERLHQRRRPPLHTGRERMKMRPGVIRLADGSEYRLIPDFQGVTLSRVLRRPKVIAIPLFVATLISGLVCFMLARYLTTPIQRLSRATQQFASGNLALRVEPAMGGRKDEIADLARDFDQMARRLQDVIGSQKQLLSDVSHELRSPLARLQVALGLARQGEQDHSNTELDRIEREAERLNELIGQLLSLSRLESGMALTHIEPVDLSDLLAEVVENTNFEVRALKRQVRIINSVSATVDANEALLSGALENVVRNAALYTDENTSVDVSLQLCKQRHGWLLIQVHDHGPGVPAEMLKKLFEPFVRVDDARDRNSGGYGLGLAIAERAINLHGGEIVARNADDGGLVVRIFFPLKRIDER